MLGEILIYGLISSALYGMLAIGLTLIIGIARVFNMAHGAFYMLGAYAVFTSAAILKIPLPIAILLSILVVALIAMCIDFICLRPLKGNVDGTLLVTFILALFFEEVIHLIYGPKPRTIPAIFTGRILIFDVSVSAQRFLVVIMAIVTLLSLWLFITKTKVGGAIQAVSQDPEAATLMGVRTKRMILFVNGLAASLASLAGILVSPALSSSPNMWHMPLLKSFTIVILGGLGSVAGSVLAALILGFSETIVSLAISPRLTELVALGILFLVIILRPSGLLGVRTD